MMEGSRMVPGNVWQLIRNVVAQSDLPYQARTLAEYVFANMQAVPFVQYHALDHLHATGELPSLFEAQVALLEQLDETYMNALSTDALKQYRHSPDQVALRAVKLAYDAYAELEAGSQLADITRTGLVMLNAYNDVKRKVDAVFYPPPEWRSSWPRVLVGFKRSSMAGFGFRELRRDGRSEAEWNFRCPTMSCEWVGTMACFPRDVLVDQIDQMRKHITSLPRAS
jgi:hypothetical protein